MTSLGGSDLPLPLCDLDDLGKSKSVVSEYNERLLQVEGLISQHVTECYEDLISQSTGIRKAEDTLTAIENKTTSSRWQFIEWFLS